MADGQALDPREQDRDQQQFNQQALSTLAAFIYKLRRAVNRTQDFVQSEPVQEAKENVMEKVKEVAETVKDKGWQALVAIDESARQRFDVYFLTLPAQSNSELPPIIEVTPAEFRSQLAERAKTGFVNLASSIKNQVQNQMGTGSAELKSASPTEDSQETGLQIRLGGQNIYKGTLANGQGVLLSNEQEGVLNDAIVQSKNSADSLKVFIDDQPEPVLHYSHGTILVDDYQVMSEEQVASQDPQEFIDVDDPWADLETVFQSSDGPIVEDWEDLGALLLSNAVETDTPLLALEAPEDTKPLGKQNTIESRLDAMTQKITALENQVASLQTNLKEKDSTINKLETQAATPVRTWLKQVREKVISAVTTKLEGAKTWIIDRLEQGQTLLNDKIEPAKAGFVEQKGRTVQRAKEATAQGLNLAYGAVKNGVHLAVQKAGKQQEDGSYVLPTRDYELRVQDGNLSISSRKTNEQLDPAHLTQKELKVLSEVSAKAQKMYGDPPSQQMQPPQVKPKPVSMSH